MVIHNSHQTKALEGSYIFSFMEFPRHWVIHKKYWMNSSRKISNIFLIMQNQERWVIHKSNQILGSKRETYVFLFMKYPRHWVVHNSHQIRGSWITMCTFPFVPNPRHWVIHISHYFRCFRRVVTNIFLFRQKSVTFWVIHNLGLSCFTSVVLRNTHFTST